jgi:hypothetical protein
VEASNSCVRTLIFGSFLLLPFLKFFSLPLFCFFNLAFYCLFSFFDLVFLSFFVFSLFFALVLYLFFCLAHVVLSLAHPNLLGNKMLGCCCCHQGKMITAFYFSVNTVMTEQLRQLLHMDIVGPSRVCSMGGKWYVLVIINDYSRYCWVFLLESNDEVFEHFWSLALRLNNEHPNCLKVIHSGNETEFRNASFN